MIGQSGMRLPEVVKNLIIINVIMYIVAMIFPEMNNMFAMYPIMSEHFRPYQVVTHMFMHSQYSITHIFFNMFALYMFGRDVEWRMGAKRFLLFYIITGLGAVFLHQLAGYIEFQYALEGLDPAVRDQFLEEGTYNRNISPDVRDQLQYAYDIMNVPAVGASGAVYGVLAAFGALFPNRMIMLLIPPIPMKAKYFVLIMGGLALYMGFSGQQAGVAHFAHLGGALFGYLMIWYWKKAGKLY